MKKILCVDDNPDFLELMEHLLTSKGFNVQLLEKGEDTEMAIRKFTPDLVLLDIVLGNIDGSRSVMQLKRIQNLVLYP
ncbi:response regulator [Pedobacter aquatilis]|uniref:response regulator n=1 Tax=Pedobacter aquatilis TaxID=351343 RepID=UPI00292DF0BE|nr:response regulator [Pedobacter aquatilis]